MQNMAKDWLSGRLKEALEEGAVSGTGFGKHALYRSITCCVAGLRYDVVSYGPGSLDMEFVIAWQALCHDADSNRLLGHIAISN